LPSCKILSEEEQYLSAMAKRLDLDSPRYDQSTYEGRVKHFFSTTNPLNVLASDAQLEQAKKIVLDYKAGKEDGKLSEDQIWEAKELYDSAYHPQTGEKLFLPGRMSFQVPGNMSITGCMLTFYKSPAAVIFWQTANQGFNAVVNYTNRNASAEVTDQQLATAAAGATTAGVGTALLFNKIIQSSPVLSGGLIGRFVPIMAVAAANCVNIPMMRSQEIQNGIGISLPDGTEVGLSGKAAVSAVSQVIPSRVAMAIPAMVLGPIIMSFAEKSKLFLRNPWLAAPTSVLLTGAFLTFSTPMCCALFPQKAAIQAKDLEPELAAKLAVKYPDVKTFYFNKGL
jgi:tricarboxylate carrier